MTSRQLSIMQEKMRQRCMTGGRPFGKRMEKTNSPTFAYQTVYGKNPSDFLPGRTSAPKKTWKGIVVDKGLKDRWLENLNNLPVEIRSTEEGKHAIRPAAIVFRLPSGQDKLHKKIVSDLRKQPGLYAKSDIGLAGRPRICVAGKVWKGQKGWKDWWDALPSKISTSYQNVIEKTAEMDDAFVTGFIGELVKLRSGGNHG